MLSNLNILFCLARVGSNDKNLVEQGGVWERHDILTVGCFWACYAPLRFVVRVKFLLLEVWDASSIFYDRHERYLGMWADNQRSGPGLTVTSTGIYCEATFSAGIIAVSTQLVISGNILFAEIGSVIDSNLYPLSFLRVVTKGSFSIHEGLHSWGG